MYMYVGHNDDMAGTCSYLYCLFHLPVEAQYSSEQLSVPEERNEKNEPIEAKSYSMWQPIHIDYIHISLGKAENVC